MFLLSRENQGFTAVTSSFRRRMGVESDHRSASTEPRYQTVSVQDAYYQTVCVSNQDRGLVCHDRSQGCILPYIHPSSTQEVPEVCFRGRSIPVLGSSVRPVTLTPHFHKVSGCCLGSVATPGHPHTELHRRLVDFSSVRADGVSASRCRPRCPVVISLLTHVNLVLSSLLRIDWSVNPSLCLLNDDSGLCISSMQKKMLFAGFTAAKKTIIQNWFTPHMCRKTYWIRSLLQIETCEYTTARVGGARPSTIDAWQCFLLDIRDCIKE